MFRVNPLVFIQSLICVGVSLFAAYYFWFGIDVSAAIHPTCWGTLLIFGWILFSWNRLTRHFLDLYIVFILATAAFNCGQIFLEVFNLNSAGLLFGKFSDRTLFETVLFVTGALVWIHFGVLVRMSQSGDVVPTNILKRAPRNLFTVGMVMVMVSLLPTLWVLKEMYEVVKVSGYFGLYGREDQIGIDNLLTLISNFFVPGMLFALAGAKRKKYFRLWGSIAIICYGGLLILLGRRGDGAEALLVYFLVFHICIRPIKKKVVIAISVFMLIVVFPLVASIRNMDLNKRGDLSTLITAYESIDNPAQMAIAEMGGSMQSIAHTLELVPKVRDYDNGASYLYAGFSVFPNLFWSIHPSVARGSPSVWLVKTVEPDIAALGGGLGYSYIAEAYFNFGWWLGWLFLAILGYALSSFMCWSQFSGDPLKIAAAASFLSSLVSFARADSQSIIRPLFWYSLLPYFLVKWTKPKSKYQSLKGTSQV